MKPSQWGQIRPSFLTTRTSAPRAAQLVQRSGSRLVILAREKQAGQGRREPRYRGYTGATEDTARRSFAAARARGTSGTLH